MARKKKIKKVLSVPHQQILAWLNADPDFTSGYTLFLKYSRNRALGNYLGRKQDLPKLTYELQKLMSQPIIDTRGVKHTAAITRALHSLQEINQEVFEDEGGEEGNKNENTGTTEPGINTGSVADIATGAGDALNLLSSADNNDEGEKEASERLKIIKNGNVIYSDLPDDLKVIYDGVVDKYKLQRTLHEKMKLATTDDGRADLRSQVVKLDDEITAGWEKIDHWANGGEMDPAQQPKKEPDPLELMKAVNAARSYLARFVPNYAKLEGKAKDELLVKIQERVKCLIEHKAPVKAATLAELNKNGIDTTGMITE